MAVFEQKAPWIMALLMADFGWSVEDAAADLGNAGHECAGFTAYQEKNPTVKGSKGGFGWYQWTGVGKTGRRKAFFDYCARNGLDPNSDEANYKFHFVELKGAYSQAVTAVRNAKTLAEKVRAFDRNYEYSGVPNYPSREKWAKRALAAYNAAPKPIKLPDWALPAKPAVVAEVPIPPETEPVAAKVPEKDSAVVVAVPQQSGPAAPAPGATHPAAWGTLLALLASLGALIAKWLGVH